MFVLQARWAPKTKRQQAFDLNAQVTLPACSWNKFLMLLRRLQQPGCLLLTSISAALVGSAGALTAVQTQAFVIIGTAATYSEELAAFFEDGEHEQALQQLKATCCKVLEIMKPVSSCQPSQETTNWGALGMLSAVVRTTVQSLPDGNELWSEICGPLKQENGFEESMNFVNGAHEASRIEFWELVVREIRSIDAALENVVRNSGAA